MVTEAAFVQLSEPPLTVGSLGSVRSMRTVAVGDQAETLPALSTVADCTSVSPSAEMREGGAGGGRRPAGAGVGGGLEAVAGDAAERIRGSRRCEQHRGHALPGSRAAGGRRRRTRRGAIKADSVGHPVAGIACQSSARKWTSVSPSAETVSVAPGRAADQVVPPSLESRTLPGQAGERVARSRRRTVSEAAFVQLGEPPLTVGAPGCVRSRRTVSVTQLLALPARSSARKRTSVSPSAETERRTGGGRRPGGAAVAGGLGLIPGQRRRARRSIPTPRPSARGHSSRSASRR